MQVSWIDPDEVRDLLRQIEGPRQGSSVSGWEVHTLPAAPMAERPAKPQILPESPAPVPRPASPVLDEEVSASPANAELWRIRERLRALRDKAQMAGILTRSPAGSTPALAPEAPEARAEFQPVPAREPAAQGGQLTEAGKEREAVIWPSEPDLNDEEGPEPPPAPTAVEGPFARMGHHSAFEPLFAAPAPPLTKPMSKPESMLPTVVAASPPFVVSPLGLSERLNGLGAWVCARLGTQEVLLVDDYGDVLWGAQGQTALVISTMMAWHSAQRASATSMTPQGIKPQRIDRSLGPKRVLTVLPVLTRYGVVSLAVIQDRPVSDADATAIRAALALAVEGTNDARAAEGA